MAGKVKTSKDYPTIFQMVEIEKGKYMLTGVVNKEQLHALYQVFERFSREWRGQYQALAKAIVEAYEKLEE